ncbi:MAG TPA: PP2C family serine/threonine-protein phosphatase [Gemmataceae bacterium]|jgi:hypothetical protein|nr:PP2C family serine/threonine-protein phosphatase [Gemmataceae bacterium]
MWKLLYGSAPGTAHAQRGEPCQDYALGEIIQVGGETILIAACADGAGSAAHAARGAELACHTLVGLIRAEGGEVGRIDRDQVMAWHARVRERLAAEAGARDADVRELACTLLTAVVGERGAVFTQIGDGAIVTRLGESYQPVFWPQAGEYVNTTHFLTDPDYEGRLDFRRIEGRVDELALFTDGLQMLALNYGDRSVHAPFFVPLFRVLRRVKAADELRGPLRDFLTSPAVNGRTDDDKTLVLASRRWPDDSD